MPSCAERVQGKGQTRITKNWGHTLSEEDQRWLRDIEAKARQTWGMRRVI